MLTSCGLPQLARSFDWAYLSLNFPLSVEHFCWLSFWYIAFTSAPALTSTTFIGVSILSEAPNIPSVFLRVGLVSLRSLCLILLSRNRNTKQSRDDGVEIVAICDHSKRRAILFKGTSGFLIAAVEFVPFERHVLARLTIFSELL